MPEAPLKAPVDAAEKGGLEERLEERFAELFAALDAAVKADVEAFRRRGNANGRDFETLLQTVHRRALATANQAAKAAWTLRS